MATKGTIEVPKIELEMAMLVLVGESELIQHAWDQKVIVDIEDTQKGKGAKGKKAARVPEEEYEAAMYRFEDGRHGHRSVAFKAAAVAAARQIDGVQMTFLRGAFHIPGELVEIEGEPYMRRDMVRLQGKTTTPRYRPGFREWKALVPVQYNKRSLTLEQVVTLFNMAGFAVGVGEWRPEKNGPYGRFRVDSVEVIG